MMILFHNRDYSYRNHRFRTRKVRGEVLFAAPVTPATGAIRRVPPTTATARTATTGLSTLGRKGATKGEGGPRPASDWPRLQGLNIPLLPRKSCAEPHSPKNIKHLVVPQQSFTAGQLPQFINNWKLISEDWETLNIVSGYQQLKFEDPPPLRVPSQEELLVHSSDEVVDQEVSNMLACGAIQEVDPTESGFFSDIFAIDKVERGKVYGKRVIISK